MKRAAGLMLTGIIIFIHFCASAATLDGPLQVKNQFPIYLPINQPYLEQATPENSFSVSLSHSSVYLMEDSVVWHIHLDMEMTELNFRYRKDVPGLFEIGLELPVLRATSGFMDRPVAWYHRTFGFPDYGRSERPYNDFLYDVRRDGSPIIEGENDRAGLGDARFTVMKKLTAADPIISLMADVELPTGDPRIGYGSGSVDAGLALLLDKDIGREARLYANLGAVFPGELRAYQTVKLENYYYAGSGIETLISRHLSLLVQFMVQTSPYPSTGISKIDNTGMILVLGGRYYANSGSYEFSLTEDPNTTGASDFILNLSYKMRF
jgi:hypothetical protein